MLASPTPGMQQVYVTFRQLVALYSQTPFKCSLSGPPERDRAVLAATTIQEAFLKEPLLKAIRQSLPEKYYYQDAILNSVLFFFFNSVLLDLEFLPQIFQLS